MWFMLIRPLTLLSLINIPNANENYFKYIQIHTTADSIGWNPFMGLHRLF